MKTMMMGSLLMVLSNTAFGSTSVLYVDADATGLNTGASWANAYTDLQDALWTAKSTATVTSPVEVWVAEGLYRPTRQPDRSVAFEMADYVGVYGD